MLKTALLFLQSPQAAFLAGGGGLPFVLARSQGRSGDNNPLPSPPCPGICRTRNKEHLDKCNIVVDVGAEYDPERSRPGDPRTSQSRSKVCVCVREQTHRSSAEITDPHFRKIVVSFSGFVFGVAFSGIRLVCGCAITCQYFIRIYNPFFSLPRRGRLVPPGPPPELLHRCVRVPVGVSFQPHTPPDQCPEGAGPEIIGVSMRGNRELRGMILESRDCKAVGGGGTWVATGPWSFPWISDSPKYQGHHRCTPMLALLLVLLCEFLQVSFYMGQGGWGGVVGDRAKKPTLPGPCSNS